MRRVYEPGSLMEAELLLAMLDSEGIAAHLSGRDLVGGMGELPAMGLLGVCVDNEHAEAARQLIAEYNAALPMFSEEPDSYPGVLLC
ncbi:putative signal transducing protein [Pseudomonas sp. nanlin1]|uniref:putative signal transducing protein n=1 Tax=Pseudomonas sp. nanlin1 TaxID=3040605 RepID=UPI00388DE1A8